MFPQMLQDTHLLVNELQTPIHSHHCLCLVLLQQHWTDLLVDVRFIVEDVEFLLHLY
jgi:hypothetical protein